MSNRNQHILFFVFLIVIALGAMATLYVSTTAGLGFGNDSVAYIGAARNILDGNGYARTSGGGEIKPITHYPPLFSLALAVGSALIHYDPLRIARGLIIILWGLSTFLGGWLVWRMARSMIAGLLFAFFFAANGSLLFVYAVIMSEPLYIVLTFAAFLSFFAYINHFPPFSQNTSQSTEPRPRKNGGIEGGRIWLIVTGIFSGLAYLTRYSGLAILGTIALVLLLTESGWKAKARAVGIYLAGALPFLLAWALRNNLRGLSATNRVLSYHPIPAEKIDLGFSAVWDWLIPHWFGGYTSDWPVLSILRASREWPGTSYLVVGVIAIGLLIWLILTAQRIYAPTLSGQANQQDSALVLFFTSTLYLFVYLAAIIFSLFFFDASTPFHDRILAPVYISLLIAFIVFLTVLWRKTKTPLKVLLILLTLSAAMISVANAARDVTRLQSDPLGFASARWRNSKLIAAIKALPPDTLLYSNSPTAIYILTDRPAYIMLTPLDPVDNQPRDSFDEVTAQMRGDLLAGKTVLVVFRPELENPDLLTQLTDGIPLYFKAGDGQIFGKP